MAPKEEFKELILNVPTIQDYQVCELFYDYRYNKQEHELILGREMLAERFENTLKRVASFFFYKKQGQSTPSYNALLNRWEKLWFPKDADAYDLATEQHETNFNNNTSYTTAAAAALMQFHEDFANDPADPILIDEKFLVPISNSVRLEGKIDLLLRYKDTFKVVKWSGRQKRPNDSVLTLDFAAQKMAFEYRNERRKRVSYYLYDLGSTRPGFVPMSPKVKDVNALVFWAKDIEQNDLFVPRRGYTPYCRSCPFDRQCSEWNEWPQYE
jgi:CRISPR/Cas system-associated exonuclease Cas4 (RecB family)